MSSSQERVQLAFEAYIRQALQLAVNYIDGDPAVERIWIYTNMNNATIQTSSFFVFRGDVLDHNGIAKADDSREYDPFEYVRSVGYMQEQMDFLRACKEAGSVPERIITDYDPAAGRLESQWDYDGVLEGPDDHSAAARKRWVESVKRDLGN